MMSYDLVVFDASTLILLAKIELLPLVADQVTAVVTLQVEREAARQPARWDAKTIRALIDDRRIAVRKAEPALMRRLVEDFRLGAGEASALALAKAEGGIVATDDGVAIKACKLAGVPFVTALHVLLGMSERRLVDRPTALMKLEQLQKAGRYHPRILEAAMSRLMQGGRAS
ncbi:MAG: hypothetical protein HYZ96_01780 [Candidatus Omnitrophica bacterium]|nr:hypothetical protein [Candidatus Omnitrophota bacterium]